MKTQNELRDEFATAALAALVSVGKDGIEDALRGMAEERYAEWNGCAVALSWMAYSLADTMLHERDRRLNNKEPVASSAA